MIGNGSYTPSVGKIGSLYFDGLNRRVKGLIPRIYTSEREIKKFASEGMEMMRDYDATRFTARVFAENCVPVPDKYKEGVIRLDGPFRGISLVYLGYNEPERMPSEETVQQELAMIESLNGQLKVHDYSGFTFEKLGEPTPNDKKQLSSLLNGRFDRYVVPLDENEVEKMLTNPNNKTYVAKYDGKIAAVAMAEEAAFELDGKEFRMTEASEMATMKQYGGKGLAQHLLRNMIKEKRKNNNLLYSESRAPALPINKTMKRNGLVYVGFLPQHCVIGGDRDIEEKLADGKSSIYENLIAWALVFGGNNYGHN
ncbi:MAG: GNAT family N-acetyltransferase [Candidatus Micrarchaeota archaeon]|nr:GNAT family N-acetyltransferase [Candidatus Micrarchaeota archaeon]